MITCDGCPDSACCRDVTVEIDEPEDLEDWDEIRWMVSHKNVSVYKDNDDDWVVEFKTPCDNLDEKNKCKVYHKRMKTCRDHAMDSCIYNGEGKVYKIRFESMEEVEKYVEEHVKPKILKKLDNEKYEIEHWEWGKD